MNIITKRSRALLTQPARAFSAHGHDDHHHEHHIDQSRRLNTQFQIPTKEEIEYQLPKHGNFNEKIHQWIAGKWAVDRDDILNNDKPNKFSAYYWFQTQTLL